MNHRLLLLAITGLIFGISGCQGTGPGAYGPGLIGNVNGTRIAPPATGTVNYPPQVANLPDPYYGRTPTPATTTQQSTINQGWRPTNPAPGTANPVGYNPNSGASLASPGNTIPGNNLVVASSTSGLQGRPATTTASTVSSTPTPLVASNSLAGGMPLTDATRNTTAGQTATTARNPAWEYVTRPNAPAYGQNQYQYATQPVYANGTIVASSSTTPGFAGPRPTSYSYTNGYPNGVPGNQVVAEGWRQRDAR